MQHCRCRNFLVRYGRVWKTAKRIRIRHTRRMTREYHIVIMKRILIPSLVMLGLASAITIADQNRTETPATQPTSTPLQFTMPMLDGKDKNLADYRGKVVLIVNTASHCGF